MLGADDANEPRRCPTTIWCCRSARCARTWSAASSGWARWSTPCCRATPIPEPVSHALGEALTLTAMLGSALKSEAQAKLILQTKTDGPLDFLVADFVAPGKLRGYANFDKADAGLAETKGRGDQGALLGKGHVAMTIDRGGDKDRYQGIVALDREPLVDAAHTYFRQSEQLPTFIRLAVARHYGPGDGDGRARVALARRRADDPAAAARGRQARGRLRQRGGRRGELEPRPPPRRHRGGPRAARPAAGAAAPALPAVPRGGRGGDARRRRSPPNAAARASASTATCASSAPTSSRTCASPTAASPSPASSARASTASPPPTSAEPRPSFDPRNKSEGMQAQHDGLLSSHGNASGIRRPLIPVGESSASR